MWENYFSLFFNSFFLDLYLTYQKRRNKNKIKWLLKILGNGLSFDIDENIKVVVCICSLGFFFLSSKTAYLAGAKLSP